MLSFSPFGYLGAVLLTYVCLEISHTPPVQAELFRLPLRYDYPDTRSSSPTNTKSPFLSPQWPPRAVTSSTTSLAVPGPMTGGAMTRSVSTPTPHARTPTDGSGSGSSEGDGSEASRKSGASSLWPWPGLGSTLSLHQLPQSVYNLVTGGLLAPAYSPYDESSTFRGSLADVMVNSDQAPHYRLGDSQPFRPPYVEIQFDGMGRVFRLAVDTTVNGLVLFDDIPLPPVSSASSSYASSAAASSSFASEPVSPSSAWSPNYTLSSSLHSLSHRGRQRQNKRHQQPGETVNHWLKRVYPKCQQHRWKRWLAEGKAQSSSTFIFKGQEVESSPCYTVALQMERTEVSAGPDRRFDSSYWRIPNVPVHVIKDRRRLGGPFDTFALDGILGLGLSRQDQVVVDSEEAAGRDNGSHGTDTTGTLLAALCRNPELVWSTRAPTAGSARRGEGGMDKNNSNPPSAANPTNRLVPSVRFRLTSDNLRDHRIELCAYDNEPIASGSSTAPQSQTQAQSQPSSSSSAPMTIVGDGTEPQSTEFTWFPALTSPGMGPRGAWRLGPESDFHLEGLYFLSSATQLASPPTFVFNSLLPKVLVPKGLKHEEYDDDDDEEEEEEEDMNIDGHPESTSFHLKEANLVTLVNGENYSLEDTYMGPPDQPLVLLGQPFLRQYEVVLRNTKGGQPEIGIGRVRSTRPPSI
ncbi:hypothetical protein BJ085DRAFT_32849 [Dimargaris cristalligena]|uniref:Uncharacterized protein n=1 Tax=Dimargaris cristalligena TaxID=215637 RepID=A0A4Q0A168_9FUNG|nr:hypothetical protein BJ085DRAFT_32849 [Dimargaris cristalligena]|eukprot:RKP39498.1 hypothetical protein BJ085DRAFT_32849 [Dimargaris cristalligena]